MPLKVEAMPVLVMRLLLTASALVVSLHLVPAAAVTAGDSNTAPRPGCPSKCGDVEIPYPFGIGKNCSWPGLDGFTITCNHSFDPPRPYTTSNVEVINITMETGEMHVFTIVSYICYNSFNTVESAQNSILSLGPPFLISPTNIFTAIGCDTLAYLDFGAAWSNYAYTGCMTNCLSVDDSPDGDPCTGLGCCQISIPGNLTQINITWNSGKDNDNNYAWDFNPCNYAFVAKKNWYTFNQSDLSGKGNERYVNRVGHRSVPLVLDWAIRDYGSCQMAAEASGKTAPAACASAYSYCIDVHARQGRGYRCNCSEGYIGNPYIPNGCTNINECEGHDNPCNSRSTCHDTPGSYKCKCKFGLRGDGKGDQGCQPIFPEWAIATIAAFAIFVVACFGVMELKRRKQRRFFEKNGGEILKSVGIKIFTEQQLTKITNGYKRTIGEGAFGQVYVGIVEEGSQRVAVKRASVKGEALPQEEFVNEITFQFRIRHPNVVHLVGCCLETDVPMLVFEFIAKGSLYNMLHGVDPPQAITLLQRVDIAIGAAEALAYMHSHVGLNLVHGDIKSGNILLDDDLTPKVSDFGSAKLVSVASMYSKWCVSGDMSYIDPVYIKSGRFTEKSDVYSFGVVLLELITRKKAKYGDNSLPLEFVKSCKGEGNGRKLYDGDILSGDDAQSHHHMECLDRIGALAVRCLKEDVDERPTMAEVLEELKQVKAIAIGGSGSVAS